ncbi:MAG TPA: glycoside hydrolase family 3 C-terminal domain-containing protein [Polyangiaceae bacterium]|nr:glycoside hydrolase family 3 C-terminal domain-containing protein [Polyangiaceae bacterium]
MRILRALWFGFGLGFGGLAAACSKPSSAGPGSSVPESGAPAGSAASAISSALPAPKAWLDQQLSPDQRADLLVRTINQREKLALVTGYFGVQQTWNHYNFKEARPQSAGFVRGVSRVGFTPQWQTDAGSGVATQREAPPALERTLLPSGILTASTWNPPLAERGGAMIGSEARSSGFNVMLAGGVNLMREPGNGRNFEYGGEDPLLAGTMVGALVRGVQSNHIVATVKHFALNNQETGRDRVNVSIDEAAARMSDLLAFQIAIEQGDPGSIMCSYNLVNGVYACQNDWLLNQVLKRDWGFKGYVMTDWGAQHDTVLNANNGLDQETGVMELNKYVWLDKLARAIEQKQVPQARLDDMVRRIARTLIAKGAVDDPVQPGPIDFAAHALVTQAAAEDGIVLLKNQGVLPLTAKAKRIAVIGGHADVGVLTGGGSAQVYAPGGIAVPGLGPKDWPGPTVYARSSPLAALRSELPTATITWQSGSDLEAAAAAAREADVAIVFATQWTTESLDFPLTLPDEQDQLVAAVARANKRTVVVLETGGPVLMPWVDQVAGVLEAWYPGSQGGPAIARVLSGAVNPSGHLPVTFPRTLEQLPRPKPPGEGTGKDEKFDVRYDEGAAVGYRWYAKKGFTPLFAFGHGLSYTSFSQNKLTARVEGELKVTFTVRNTGKRSGKAVAQIYVSPEAGGWESPQRLGAFAKVELAPGASQELTLTVDPRLLAIYEADRQAFRIAAGAYRVTLATSAPASAPASAKQSVLVTLAERVISTKK